MQKTTREQALTLSDISIDEIICGNVRNAILGKTVKLFMSPDTYLVACAEDTMPDKVMDAAVMFIDPVTDKRYRGYMIGEDKAICICMPDKDTTVNNDIFAYKAFSNAVRDFHSDANTKETFTPCIELSVDRAFIEKAKPIFDRIKAKFGAFDSFVSGRAKVEDKVKDSIGKNGAIKIMTDEKMYHIMVDGKFLLKGIELVEIIASEAIRIGMCLYALLDFTGVEAKVTTAIKKLEARDKELK